MKTDEKLLAELALLRQGAIIAAQEGRLYQAADLRNRRAALLRQQEAPSADTTSTRGTHDGGECSPRTQYSTKEEAE